MPTLQPRWRCVNPHNRRYPNNFTASAKLSLAATSEQTLQTEIDVMPKMDASPLATLFFCFSSRMTNPAQRSHQAVLHQRLALQTDPDRRIDYRLAATHLDLYGAFELLQRRYSIAGLSKPNMPLRVEPFHLWRQSQVFVAVSGATVVGCMTLIRPGHRDGLPSIKMNKAVEPALPKGAVLGEVTSLAIDTDNHCRTSEVFLRLTELMQMFALRHGVNHAAAVVHPKHARMYQRALGFKVIGQTVPCDRVAGRPGVTLIRQISHSMGGRLNWQQRFSPSRACQMDLSPRPMTERQKRFFSFYMTNRPSRYEYTKAA